MTGHHLSGFLLTLPILLAASVACAGSEAAPPAQGSESQACSDLAGLRLAITRASSLSAFSTSDDVRRTQAAIDGAADDLASNPEVDATRLKVEVSKFDKLAVGVPPGITIGQSAAVLTSQTAAIGRLASQLDKALDCP